jgi:hypothetical protein
MKYKEKIARRRKTHPIKKSFKGRSKAASTKVRVNGRFVSISMNAEVPACFSSVGVCA